MSKAVVLAIVIIVIIAAAAGAYYFFAMPKAAEPIKIGVLTPLSPPGDATAGQLIVRGAEIAVEELNERGGVLGRPVELVVEDDSGTPEKGVAGIKKLITSDKVVAVLGQFHSSVALAVQDVAEEYGAPLFITQASSMKITEKHLKTTFRTHAIDPDRAKLWLNFIKEKGFKRVAILAENTDYGLGLIDQTKALAPELGVDAEFNYIVFDRKTTDLTPQLLQVKDWGPDLVINVGVGAAAYLMISQAYDIGLFPEVPMLASYDFPVRPEYWQNLGEKGTHLLFISYYHPHMKLTEMGEKFKKTYMEKYGEPPIYASFNAYAQVMIIADAIEKAGSAEPTKIIDALLKNEFLSWNGVVKFERGEGPYWQQWSPPMIIVQYIEPNQAYEDAPIIYPPEYKTGEMVLP